MSYTTNYVAAFKKDNGKIRIRSWRSPAARASKPDANRPGPGSARRQGADRRPRPRARRGSGRTPVRGKGLGSERASVRIIPLAALIRLQLDLPKTHGDLRGYTSCYAARVRAELLAMSPATIDRYLKPAKANDAIGGIAATTAGPLLRTSITGRRAGDEATPGFFKGDIVQPRDLLLRGLTSRRSGAFATVWRTQLRIACSLVCSSSATSMRTHRLEVSPSLNRSR